MKKRQTPAFGFLAILILVNSSFAQVQKSTSTSWTKVKTDQKGTLVCLWNEAYGIIYKDKNNELKGVCIGILNDFVEFAKEKYNAEITLRYEEEKNFGDFLKRVSTTPTVLGVSSVSITDERKKTLRFTNPFLTNPNIIVTGREAPKLTRLEDIGAVYKGFHVKVVEGSIHYVYAQELRRKHCQDLTIETAGSSRTILEEVAKSKNMFTIIDFAEYIGATRNKMNLVSQNVQVDFVDMMGFIMSQKSDWGPVWDEFLSKGYLKSSGYRKIILENMGSSYLALLPKQEDDN